MKYDFDRLIDRRNTNSLKWNVKEGELAMWVADMDFQTAPCIREAVQKRQLLESMATVIYRKRIIWHTKAGGADGTALICKGNGCCSAAEWFRQFLPLSED